MESVARIRLSYIAASKRYTASALDDPSSRIFSSCHAAQACVCGASQLQKAETIMWYYYIMRSTLFLSRSIFRSTAVLLYTEVRKSLLLVRYLCTRVLQLSVRNKERQLCGHALWNVCFVVTLLLCLSLLPNSCAPNGKVSHCLACECVCCGSMVH